MNTLTREMLNKELNDIPENLLLELYDFIKYLKFREQNQADKTETAFASETVLGKDWNKPEEDEAWKNL